MLSKYVNFGIINKLSIKCRKNNVVDPVFTRCINRMKNVSKLCIIDAVFDDIFVLSRINTRNLPNLRNLSLNGCKIETICITFRELVGIIIKWPQSLSKITKLSIDFESLFDGKINFLRTSQNYREFLERMENNDMNNENKNNENKNSDKTEIDDEAIRLQFENEKEEMCKILRMDNLDGEHFYGRLLQCICGDHLKELHLQMNNMGM